MRDGHIESTYRRGPPSAGLFVSTKCPVLAIYGGKDLQVPANEDIRKLEKITAGKTNFTIVSLPGLDHLMQTADKGLPSEYGKIEETIAPVALTTMGDWLKKVL